jgi:LacI family transcriptional regulator
MIKLKDVALRSGYSINTVSRALKDKPDIAPKTRELIQQIAQEMGYINDAVAGSLRSGVTKTIAIILGDISNPHFSIMVKEIESKMRSYKYNTIIMNTDEDAAQEKEAIYSALQKKVDGVIICPVQGDESLENIKFLKNTKIPFVLIGRHFPSLRTDYVVCDDTEGGYLATQFLLNLGHRKIAFLNAWNSKISSSAERFEGYRRALSESGVPYDKSLYFEVSRDINERLAEMRRIFEKPISFTAIFAFSDMIAWEAAAVMHDCGLQTPNDVSIIGFDNIQSKIKFPFPLTSISSNKSQMSIDASEILYQKMNNPGKTGYTQRILPTNVVDRGSCIRI